MGEFCFSLKLILWKNYLHRRRSIKRCIIEIFWPLILFIILVWVRSRGFTSKRPDCHLLPRSLPSVGGFEYIRNAVCGFRNPCFDHVVEEGDPFESSEVNTYVPALEPFLIAVIKNQDALQKIWNILNITSSSNNSIPPFGHNRSSFARTLTDLAKHADVSKWSKRLEAHRIADKRASSSSKQRLNIGPNQKLDPEELKDFQKKLSDLMCGESQSFNEDADQNPFTTVPWRDQNVLSKAYISFKPDPTASRECNKWFYTFSSSGLETNLIWSVIKPYVRGMIYYAPKNDFTDAVMKKVDDKIKELKGLESNIALLSDAVERMHSWMQLNKESLDNIQKNLQNSTGFVDKIMDALGLTDPSQRQEVEKLLLMLSDVDRLQDYIDQMNSVLKYIKPLTACIKYDRTVGVRTERQAIRASKELLEENRLWAVVSFDMDSNDVSGRHPHNLRFKIRMDSDRVDGTERVHDRVSEKRKPRTQYISETKYLTFGFLSLQEMVERAIAELKTRTSFDNVGVYMQQFPYPCYIFDIFIQSISSMFPMFMILSWVYSAAMMMKSIVYEKENHLKEMMKVMGLSNLTLWLAWFIDNFIFLFVSATLLTLILKFGNVLTYSDFTLIWFFMITYVMSVITFCFLCSTIFQHANSAAAAGGITFFLTYLPYALVSEWLARGLVTWYEILPVCLFANVAFGFGCRSLAELELDGTGAQWSVLYESEDSDRFALGYSIAMLWLDSALYFLATLYIEAITPGSGIPKPWYFPFLMSTYRKSPSGANGGMEFMQNGDDSGAQVEPVPEGLVSGVKIRGLSKTYSNGNVALKNLNLDFYQDQITSFLGHNGAGKTTTISILTGIFPPTKGTALINGFDIINDSAGARRSVGICPQYNIVFDKLTVSEHILFFSGLKGKKLQVTKEELNKILEDLGIPEKKDELPKKLSGGMKRKLCVAIAFSGGSKIIFLDEPTSGVDPFSRRAIWELLLKYKPGRTIILTTHYMDEADILGDRIAIISRGALKTCGSSLFLKSNFGQGYSLHLVRQRQEVKRVSRKSSGGDDIQALNAKVGSSRAIVKFVKLRIPESVLISNIGTDMSFVLPYSSVSSFSGLFNELDSNMQELGVTSYGISDTSLEDVFLKITYEDLEKPDDLDSDACCRCCCCYRDKSDINKVQDFVQRSNAQNTVVMFSDTAEQVTSVDTNKKSSYDYDSISINAEEEKDKDPFQAPIEQPQTPVLRSSIQSAGSPYDETRISGEAQVRPVISAVTARTSVYPSMINQAAPKTSKCLCCKQAQAIISKRFKNSKRSLKSTFFEIILPACFVAAALTFTMLIPQNPQSKMLKISPYLYRLPLHIFVGESVSNISNNSGRIPIGKEYSSRIINQLVGVHGFSTECLEFSVEPKFCKPENYRQEDVDAFNFNRKRFSADQVHLGTCDCSTGAQKCSESVEGTRPPLMKTHSEAVVKDVSEFPLTRLLLNTYIKYFWYQNGGYHFETHAPYKINMTRFIRIFDEAIKVITDENHVGRVPTFQEDKPMNAIIVWFQNKAWVSSLAYLNSLHNMMLRDATLEEDFKRKAGITLFQHPLSLTQEQIKRNILVTTIMGVLLSICVISALSYVPASFVLYLIHERASGAKHLHLVAGVTPLVYWLANYIYDLFKYTVPVLVCILLFYVFDAQAFISEYSVLPFTVLLLLYGWAIIPLMYPASFVFLIPSTAIVVLACVNLFIGVITTVSQFIIVKLGGAYPDLNAIGDTLGRIFMVFPQFCLGKGMIVLVELHAASSAQTALSLVSVESNRFEFEILGKYFIALGVQGFVFFLLTVLLDYRMWFYSLICKFNPKFSGDLFDEEDEDVREERDLVMMNDIDPDSVLVAKWLTKFYKRKKTPAVNGITFAMSRGECFGLLGINGAGKTTTFKMLTGDVLPSAGKASIAGYDVVLQRDKARKFYGYCPQEDGLDFLLTADEMLKLYGNLHGMKSQDRKQSIESLIQALGLSRYAKRKCGTYSGGNKRKLSTAVALIGDPDLIFLDEPTSGMDPGARRQLWKVILYLIHKNKSVVLTSHSMEECEALCTRLGIMVNGKFECLGSTQHLKNRFGLGYILTIRCLEENQPEFFKMMDEKLPNAKLDSSHCTQIKYKVGQESAKLSEMFEVMFQAEKDGLIEDYSVSQTTLDDIFVKFASHQREE